MSAIKPIDTEGRIARVKADAARVTELAVEMLAAINEHRWYDAEANEELLDELLSDIGWDLDHIWRHAITAEPKPLL